MSQSDWFPVGTRRTAGEVWDWRPLHTSVSYWPASDRSSCVKALTLICKRSWTQEKTAVVEIGFAWLTCNTVWEHRAYWFWLSSGKGPFLFQSLILRSCLLFIHQFCVKCICGLRHELPPSCCLLAKCLKLFSSAESFVVPDLRPTKILCLGTVSSTSQQTSPWSLCL